MSPAAVSTNVLLRSCRAASQLSESAILFEKAWVGQKLWQLSWRVFFRTILDPKILLALHLFGDNSTSTWSFSTIFECILVYTHWALITAPQISCRSRRWQARRCVSLISSNVILYSCFELPCGSSNLTPLVVTDNLTKSRDSPQKVGGKWTLDGLDWVGRAWEICVWKFDFGFDDETLLSFFE